MQSDLRSGIVGILNLRMKHQRTVSVQPLVIPTAYLWLHFVPMFGFLVDILAQQALFRLGEQQFG